MNEIAALIKKRGLKPKDCAYHTIRILDNGGKARALVVKGEKDIHIEYTCPFCKASGYNKQEYVKVSKAAMYRFSTKCKKCDKIIKIPKLKGGKKKKEKS